MEVEVKDAQIIQKPEQPQQLAPAQVRAPIQLNAEGVFQPTTLDEAYRLASMYVKSGMLPARFDTPEKALTGMQLAKELRLPGLVALRQIAVVQGTPTLFGDLPLALVQRDGNLEWMKEFLINAKGERVSFDDKNLSSEIVAAICIAKRKGDKEPVERSFSFEDAKRAGLGNSPTWKSYPKVMLKYRARSQMIKDKFPDSLNGIAIAEYDFHVIPSEDSPALQGPAADLNKQFLEEPPQ